MQNIILSPLTRRITMLIVLGLIITSVAILYRLEAVMEQALLEQAQRQAKVFMHGIESKLHTLEDPTSPQQMQAVINELMASDLSLLDFSIYQMYFFSKDGKVLAHSKPGDHADKTMLRQYAPVFEKEESIVGGQIERIVDADTGQEVLKTDVIVPHHLDGRVFAALEVEIDLKKTSQLIEQLDKRYEKEIYSVVIVASMATVLFIWLGMFRWTVQPIRNLVDVTNRISQGELDARLVVEKRKDEIMRLTCSINDMAENIEKLFNEQEQAHIQMLQTLSRALEAKDSYTAGHSGRVAHYSVKLGRRVGLTDDELKLLKQGALMHDLGKIGIADSILNKPGPLDVAEYEIMKKHPVNTAVIMKPLKRFKEFVEIAAWHHERWDGDGYPDGLKGEEIPLLARIVCIADTWDAMTGDRVYRKGMSVQQALHTMRDEKHEGQWDPELLEHFIEMIKEEAAKKNSQSSLF